MAYLIYAEGDLYDLTYIALLYAEGCPGKHSSAFLSMLF